MYLTVDTMHSRNFSKYISINRSLLCEPRRICNTNAVNGGAGCQRIYWQMLWLNSLNTIHTGSIRRNSDSSNSMMKNKVGSFPSIAYWNLVAIVQHDLQLKRSTYEVLQILSISLMDKTPLVVLFERTDFNNIKELDCPLFPGLFD